MNDLTGLPVAFTVAADHSAVPPPPGELDCGDNVIEPCPGPDPIPLPPSIKALLHQLLDPGPPCTPGDVSKPCIDRCALDFAPGIDGAYTVFVGPTAGTGGLHAATQGHVATGSHPVPPPLLTECSDLRDNDNDGTADWFNPGASDSGCDRLLDDDESG